jgi:NADH:ubiquinone oxidoreductase subunit 3 (subunit A)
MFIKLFFYNYLIIFIFFIISILIASLLFLVSYLFGSQIGGSEKLSSYECGFEPFEDSRNTFDVRFYLVAILFIIFDIEVTFLFPWAVSLSSIGFFGFWVMMDFLIELTIGYVYVWKKGALDY